jgi:hypothetical protein
MQDHDDLGMAFRHTGWQRDRQRVDLALQALGVADDRLARFRGCGADARVCRSVEHPDRIRIRATYCNDRFCVPCAVHHGRNVSARIRTWIGNQPARFVTLTLRHDGEPLAHRLDRLYRSFKHLRRGKWWRSRVTGGLATVEVKWCVSSAHWHPHLHILCRGSFLPAGELSREWHVATGDSYIVDVTLVEDSGQTADYVAKYVAKPGSNTVYREANRLQEMMSAMHGRRLLLTFGDCKLPEQEQADDQDTWESLGTLDEILWQAERGVPDAVAIVNQLRRITPCLDLKTRPPPFPSQA